MSTRFDLVSGSIIPNKIPENLCWGSPNEFLKGIQEWLSVELRTNSNNSFVVQGFQTPGPDDNNKMWAKCDQNGNFEGWQKFIKGAWRPAVRPGNQIQVGDGEPAPDGYVFLYKVQDADDPIKKYDVYEFIGY